MENLEKVFLAKLLPKLRKALPGAVIFKHNDQMTRAIPDASITWLGRTTWCEGKVVRDGKIKIDPAQRYVMEQIERQSSPGWAVQAYYLIGQLEAGHWRFVFRKPSTVGSWALALMSASIAGGAAPKLLDIDVERFREVLQK